MYLIDFFPDTKKIYEKSGKLRKFYKLFNFMTVFIKEKISYWFDYTIYVVNQL